MRKEVKGIGIIKGGICPNIFVDGIAFSLGDNLVKRLHVNGIFRSKKMEIEDTMMINGIVQGDIHFFGGSHIGMIRGVAQIQKKENAKVMLKGDAEISADKIVMDSFNLKGWCRAKSLEANTVSILESDSKKKQRNNESIIDEIVCNKLTAYNLSAEKVVAEQVELYGKCKINTLVYKEKTHVSPTCIIKAEQEMV